MTTKRQVILIILLLSVAGIAFFITESFFNTPEGEPATHAEMKHSTGFPEYDLIPAALKEKMQELKAAHYNINYTYWYYFDTADVNYHYYIADAGIKIIEEMPVTDPQALAMVDTKWQENRGNNIITAQHPDLIIDPSATKEEREKYYKKVWEKKDDPSHVRIQYIMPEDTIDFSKLRVAIMADNLSLHTRLKDLERSIKKSELHEPSAIDTLPVPVRGYDYFEKVMVKELMKYDVFTFYDLKGEVTVEFTIGSAAYSPNIINGFSTREDSYEAYQADGAFIKALNKLKVRWKPGKQGNAIVDVRIPLTFQVDGQKIKMLNHPPALAGL